MIIKNKYLHLKNEELNKGQIKYLIGKLKCLIDCACSTYRDKHLSNLSIAKFKSPKEKLKRTIDNRRIEEVNKILKRLEYAYRNDEKIILNEDNLITINNTNEMVKIEFKKSLIMMIVCILVLIFIYFIKY